MKIKILSNPFYLILLSLLSFSWLAVCWIFLVLFLILKRLILIFTLGEIIAIVFLQVTLRSRMISFPFSVCNKFYLLSVLNSNFNIFFLDKIRWLFLNQCDTVIILTDFCKVNTIHPRTNPTKISETLYGQMLQVKEHLFHLYGNFLKEAYPGLQSILKLI